MTVDALTRAVYPVILDAVERAIMPRFQTLQAGEIIDKGGNELVTVADREAEVILAEGLARILPEATIVGEEAASADPTLLDRLGDDLCWIIDPVDGTNNFAAGRGP
ncbi:MAG: inositol monophosphatase, partial [Sphingomonadales bacterium]|nr:inositol monophosphatase [Sphingomonadales bacterium]